MIPHLENIYIPRWIDFDNEKAKVCLDTFVDANKNAHATALFPQVETERVSVHSVAAKPRVKVFRSDDFAQRHWKCDLELLGHSASI